MKTIFILLAIISSTQTNICMSSKSSPAPSSSTLSRVAQTVSDKWEPTGILEELRKNGISKNDREKMTQMHRLDRIVPLHIENNETEKLCANLTTITTKNYPLSNIAREMARDYLWKLRPSLLTDKPLLDRVTTVLDLLNPAQIIDDLKKGQTYSEQQIDLENRLNRAIEQLVTLQETSKIQQLIGIIATRNEKESTTIIPGERVLQLAHTHLSNQEKESKEKKELIEKTFGTKKSNSEKR